jgi:hypothetical protein
MGSISFRFRCVYTIVIGRDYGQLQMDLVLNGEGAGRQVRGRFPHRIPTTCAWRGSSSDDPGN